jgi:hypothetical protein
MGNIKGQNCWPVQFGTVYEAVYWTFPLELTCPGTDFRTTLWLQNKLFYPITFKQKIRIFSEPVQSSRRLFQSQESKSITPIFSTSLHVTWDRDSRLATSWTVRGSNPRDGEIFRTRPDQSRGPLSPLFNGYRVFRGGKAAGEWRWPSTSSSAAVKERVKQYLCSPSGPSWPDLGWPSPLLNVIYVASELFFSMLDHFVRFPETFF